MILSTASAGYEGAPVQCILSSCLRWARANGGKLKTKRVTLSLAVWRRLNKTAKTWHMQVGPYLERELRRTLKMNERRQK